MKKAIMIIFAALLTCVSCSSTRRPEQPGIVFIGTNATVMVEYDNQYFRILSPKTWSISQVTQKDWLPKFNVLDSNSNHLFTIVVNPVDNPGACGCGFVPVKRKLTDSRGNVSYDLLSKEGQRSSHKEFGTAYYVDIHLPIDCRKTYNPFIDAIIDSLEVK